MFNRTKKLDRADLEELREKEKLIRQQNAILTALLAQRNVWLITKFSKYGLDGNLEYNFDLKTGLITKVAEKTKHCVGGVRIPPARIFILQVMNQANNNQLLTYPVDSPVWEVTVYSDLIWGH
ncbi:MAG: hypothetical protein UX50_C0013G0014 [Candidatus Beckwithbacteria bacterium GW2011_GWA1_46_30]|nr:MAG: hypothetical protein UX50_C0013G0014 [Candidatus Beckwithbacteria bacterium GW2011_GWA1_46_30]